MRNFILAITCASLSFCQVSQVHGRGPEDLVISNETDSPIRVFMKSNDPRSPDLRWQGPLVVAPGKEEPFRLSGYQPFDIDIRLDDDTDIVTESPVSLCWMMDNCRPGNQDWTVTARGWRRDKNGGRHLDPSLDRQLELHVDKNTIKLPIVKLIGKKLPDPIPAPAPPPPKHPQ
jgi:hypothetical protein